MNDDTRKLLKVFGVAVTDAEAEAERLAGTAAQLSASAGKEEIAVAGHGGPIIIRDPESAWGSIGQCNRIGLSRDNPPPCYPLAQGRPVLSLWLVPPSLARLDFPVRENLASADGNGNSACLRHPCWGNSDGVVIANWASRDLPGAKYCSRVHFGDPLSSRPLNEHGSPPYGVFVTGHPSG